MTPNDLMMLLQIHVYPYMDQITMINGSLGADCSKQRLLRNNLIECESRCQPRGERRTRSPYVVTERGKVHINRICNADFPVLVERWE